MRLETMYKKEKITTVGNQPAVLLILSIQGEKRKKKRRERLTGRADGEEELHRVEEEEHDEQGNGSAQRQAERLHGIQRLNI